MNDTTYCNGHGCEIRDNCLRFKLHCKKPKVMLAWYMNPAYVTLTQKCENFIKL